MRPNFRLSGRASSAALCAGIDEVDRVTASSVHALYCTRSGPVLLRFLGRLHEEAIHARQQEASEKRQGTKSREVWHPTVQERLWGIRHVDCGVDLGREALGGAILGRWE